MGRLQPPDEVARWDLARRGDEPSFGLIFDEHRDRVFQHAYSFLRNRHDAEDVLATAFLELWRRRDAVQVINGSVLPWLLVTAANTAMSSQRARQRYRKLLGKIPHGDTARSAEEEAFARNHAFSPELHDAIHRFGQVDRGLVALVIVEGYSTAEAASVLGITPGTARTRLSRLRTKLRLELSPAHSSALANEGASS